MTKKDTLAAKLKPTPLQTAPTEQAPRPSLEDVENFVRGAKSQKNATITFHFSFAAEERLRRYFSGRRPPRGTLSSLVEAMVVEGLEKRGG
jgi:hypothetical protein